MSATRFTLPTAVHILFFKEEKLLLSLRKNISFDGLYGLVAGHLDGEETVANAVIREAKEEVGVEIEPKDIYVSTICHSRANNKEFIQFYVVCKKWHGEITNKEPEKCDGLKYFQVGSLPKNIVPYVKDAIEKVRNGISFYEYGWNGEK